MAATVCAPRLASRPLTGTADVARASLYTAFGSKDELIERRSSEWRTYVEATLAHRWAAPRERLLGVFELLGEWFAAPGYRGCPFINASAEARPGGAIEAVTDAHRAWVRGLFAGLAGEAGAAEPEAVGDHLILLYDGAMVAAQLDRSAAACADGRWTKPSMWAAAFSTAITKQTRSGPR